ncbi:nucleotide exchange factor GrpE [Carboxydothermus ferrireducens]|uniref:Protein GrpE n=1 Tax=Carboxydothermus ferrireducens DSM 11255 TaxID=1119529 RepID=A0ABX2R8X0_9THEO|nr:nucleotide exchange factor GrpE [Carboxydothermus ferrireducens]NYE56307.1 molecular chaperone GrpE [Carboxydothermus ferrireducens DSM 11255]
MEEKDKEEKVTGENLEPEDKNLEQEDKEEVVGPQEEQQIDEAKNWEEEYNKLLDEHNRLKNQYLRLYADFDNYRKRTQREKEELLKYEGIEFLKKLLPVLDNFERALKEKDTDPQKVIEGVELTHRQLLEILNQHEVKAIEAQGQPFNPELHEALMVEVREDLEENTVIEELVKGYFYKDKVLRPALVKVSKKQ